MREIARSLIAQKTPKLFGDWGYTMYAPDPAKESSDAPHTM